jgi:hypothetical protein
VDDASNTTASNGEKDLLRLIDLDVESGTTHPWSKPPGSRKRPPSPFIDRVTAFSSLHLVEGPHRVGGAEVVVPIDSLYEVTELCKPSFEAPYVTSVRPLVQAG